MSLALSSYTRADEKPIPTGAVINRQSAIAFLAAMVMLVTLGMSPTFLNQFMNYTLPGGGFFEKFHPASYLSGVLLVVTLLSTSHRRPLDKYLLTVLAMFVLIAAYLAAREKTALAAVVIDVHIAPTILLLALSRLNFGRVRALMALFVGVAVLNALIVIFEYATGASLVPVPGRQELFFRPSGLADHPIMAGTVFYCAMLVAARGVVPPRLARPLLLLLLFVTALCGVRGPLAMALLILLAHVVRPFAPRRGVFDRLFDFGLIPLLPIAILAAVSMGFLDRILTLGLWEESSQSRFLIFDAVGLLSSSEFWSGVDGYYVAESLASQTTGGKLIENAFVLAVLQAGFPSALMLAVSVISLHARAMRKNLLFSAAILFVAFSTLGFGVKNPIPLAIAMAGYLIYRQHLEDRRP
jgi:hypothetical protein